MDIFVSGYGNLKIYTDLLFIRFLNEEKIKFLSNFSSFK